MVALELAKEHEFVLLFSVQSISKAARDFTLNTLRSSSEIRDETVPSITVLESFNPIISTAVVQEDFRS